MRHLILAIFLTLCGLMLPHGVALAQTVEVKISISAQEMEVFQNGERLYVWPVSTAKSPKITPKGSWTPQFLSRNHRSSLYGNAPMPWSIFYSGNYAIHGTNATSRLGRPASHGCVRLHPENAKILFNMVKAEGKANTRVTVTD